MNEEQGRRIAQKLEQPPHNEREIAVMLMEMYVAGYERGEASGNLRELRATFDGRLWSMNELKTVLGVKDARTVKRLLGLDSLDRYGDGKYLRYWGGDIAKRLDAMKGG